MSSSENGGQGSYKTKLCCFSFEGRLPWDKPKVLPWVVLAWSILDIIFMGGEHRAFGVLVSELHVRFNDTDLVELDWIGNSDSAVGFLTTGISSAIILYCNRRYDVFQLIGALFTLVSHLTSALVPSPAWLFFTNTVLHGIGSSLILSSTGLVINDFFDKSNPYHVVATSLIACGAVASMIFVELFAFLVDHLGWRGTFLVVGIIYFIVNGGSALFLKRNESKHDEGNGERKLCKCSCDWGDIVTKRHVPLLILWSFDRVITTIISYGLMMNLVDFMRGRSINAVLSSTLYLTLFAAGQAISFLIGVIITAITRDILFDRLRYVLIFFTFLMANCLIGWEYSTNDHVSATLAFFTGFCIEPSLAFTFPAGEEISRLPGNIAFPFSLAGEGVGILISPLFSAAIAERFQYKYFFLVQGGIIYIKLVLLVIATIIIHCYHPPMAKRDDYETLDETPEVNSTFKMNTPANQIFGDNEASKLVNK